MLNSAISFAHRWWRHMLRWLSPQTGAIAFVALVCLILIGHEASRLGEMRSEAIEDGRKDTTNLVRSLAQHASDTFKAVDAVLIGVVDRHETEAHDADSDTRMRPLFQAEIASLPQIKVLAIIDEDGGLVANSLPPAGRISVADRDYFQYHRANPDAGLHIGKPVVGRAAGEWIVPVSRRIN